ncbi:MAG TPA: hypothetical protein [Caudoviricetes sp.]|nr:MAG TPA: hypothetical protein [Caudoviricetes sp.]
MISGINQFNYLLKFALVRIDIKLPYLKTLIFKTMDF